MAHPQKTVTICPKCEQPEMVLQTRSSTHLDKESHLVVHYIRCKNCGTRCRLTSHAVMIHEGKIPESETVVA